MKWKKVKKSLKAIYMKKFYAKLFRTRYLKKIGLNFTPGQLHLYGRVDFSTEPWIITIGKNVYITDGCKFITHDGGTLIFRQYVPDLEITKPIVVGDNVYFGNNVIVLPGVTIGSNVVIGAGAVVTKDIPDNCVAAGVPARVIKTAEEYFEKLKRESLHLGHLYDEEKDRQLRKYYNYQKP